jgi:5-methylcytosine-specific restriction endonuclease McrA
MREEGQLSRVRRRHDKARTPFDRLRDTDAILPAHKEQLEALRDSINPRHLRLEIYDDIDAIFELSCAQPDSTQNVYTLAKNCDNGKEPLSNLTVCRTHVKPQT